MNNTNTVTLCVRAHFPHWISGGGKTLSLASSKLTTFDLDDKGLPRICHESYSVYVWRGKEWCMKLTTIRECCDQLAVGGASHLNQRISA